MKIILLYLIFFFSVSGSNAQRLQESWKYYLSFANGLKVVEAGTKIYCATEGGLFYYDRDDNSIREFCEINGLTDFGIRNINYNNEYKTLVVAYNNSNIDLVFESEVINISDIKRKQITGDKNIYNISFSGNEAFLSCGFGIVVLNLAKKEVKDTYLIGDGGSPLRVNDVEIFGPFIYAATDQGILRADRNNPNLLDYRNWEHITDIPHSGEKFSHLAIHAGFLLVNYTPDLYDRDEMYRLTGDLWERYIPRVNFIHDVQVNNNYMVVAGRHEIFIVDRNNRLTGIINKYNFEQEEVTSIKPRSVIITADGYLWVADNESGMVRISDNNFEQVFPEGPEDNKAFYLFSGNKDLWVAAGGRSDAWNNLWESPRFRVLRNGQWTEYSKNEYPEMDGFFDILNLAVDPADPEHIYAGSWGGGLLEFYNNELLNRFTNYNSPLQTALPGQPGEPYVRIGGLDFDSEGNLWITNSEVPENLLKLTPGGEWKSFTLPEIAGTSTVGPLIVTQNDDIWIIAPRGKDAYVMDKTGARKKRLTVTSYFNNGEKEIFNRMNDIYCIAEDLDGTIWLGTSKGVAVYNNPQRIWDTEEFYAVQPSLDLKDGLYHPLLETETVTSITVDGANRKWIGTSSSGVYLVSDDGEEEILHFTFENSPLLSDNITAVSVDQLTGEVFFGTGKGLVSYQGDAIGGKDAFANVYVYPNPVRESWDGPVIITGLMENTDVKITDITGNLVHQTTSLGGQAVWDGKNLNGNRVRTGVYLVFCTGKRGDETHIEKLLFIN
jgi:hypothetical protein